MGLHRGERVLFRTRDRVDAQQKAKDLGGRIETRNKPTVDHQDRDIIYWVIGYDGI